MPRKSLPRLSAGFFLAASVDPHLSLKDYRINVNILWCEANQTGFGTITEFVFMDFSLKRVINILLTVVMTGTERWR
jgi:hypothetical protein